MQDRYLEYIPKNDIEQPLTNICSQSLYVEEQIKLLKKNNKKVLFKNLKLCNCIHNLSYFILELIQYQNVDLYYQQYNLQHIRDYFLYYNLWFVIPLNFFLPVLLGYARDFVNQVATIKISFALVFLGISFQYLAMCFGRLQLCMVGTFIFMIGKEVFFVAGLTLIYDYYPKIKKFSLQICEYSSYGWSLPRILANILLFTINSFEGVNKSIYDQRYLLLILTINILFIEGAQISQILDSQQQLEDTQEINIRDYKNPFRKHNLKVTIIKYLKNYHFMIIIFSISIVVGISNTQFISYFNSNMDNNLKDLNPSSPNSIPFFLSFVQATSQLISNQKIRQILKKQYSFEKISEFYQMSGFFAFIFFLITYFCLNVIQNYTVCIVIQTIANIFSGMALSSGFITDEIFVLYYQQDYMIGIGFGLVSSFMMLFWTLSVSLASYFRDEGFNYYALSCLIISFVALILTNLIGSKIQKNQQNTHKIAQGS